MSNKPCNYCNHKWLLIDAENRGEVITKIGENYYRHKPKISLKSKTPKELEGYFVAWYMELPDSCRC